MYRSAGGWGMLGPPAPFDPPMADADELPFFFALLAAFLAASAGSVGSGYIPRA